MTPLLMDNWTEHENNVSTQTHWVDETEHYTAHPCQLNGHELKYTKALIYPLVAERLYSYQGSAIKRRFLTETNA